MEYGLIGGKLGHSYSKTIHELLCGYSYELCPLPTEADARAFLQRRQFKAINVTIPYKKLVMEYCSFIDPCARAIGAVNTVVNKNGLLYGYNTDYLALPTCAKPTAWNLRARPCSSWAPAVLTTPPARWHWTRRCQGADGQPHPPTRKRAS